MRLEHEEGHSLGREARGIQSIEVGGRLLKALVEHAVPMTLKDLAAAADLAPAQAHAYLVSYRRTGLVRQDEASGRYQMGAFAMRLAIARLRTVPILAAALHATTHIARELGLMATLAVWGPHGPTVVHKQDGDEALNVNVRVGTMFGVMGTATGQTFAAFAPRARIGPRLEAEQAGEVAADGKPPLSRERLEAILETVRAQGYAVTHEAPVPAVNAVAAPVFDEDGQLAAVLTLIGSLDRLPLADARDPALVRLLEVAADLGHRHRDDAPGRPAEPAPLSA